MSVGGSDGQVKSEFEHRNAEGGARGVKNGRRNAAARSVGFFLAGREKQRLKRGARRWHRFREKKRASVKNEKCEEVEKGRAWWVSAGTAKGPEKRQAAVTPETSGRRQRRPTKAVRRGIQRTRRVATGEV